jgi:hypothetical protein
VNYFAVHVQSNIIYKVIASSSVPTGTETTRFVPASDGRVNQFLERVKWGKPIGLYSIIPKPKTPEILPLTPDDRTSLIDYVLKCRHRETVERMAWAWRVSERTVREVLEDL